MLIVGDYSGNLNPRVRDLSGNSIAVNFTGLGPDVLKMGGYPGVVYDETNDVFLVFKNTASGILTYRVDANTFVVDEPNISGTLPATRQNGIQNSIQYVPELGGVVIANSYYGNVKFMRTAVIGPVATAFTLSGPTSGTTNSPATFTVTPMGGPLSAGAIVNISASGAIVSTSTLTFEAGTTTPQTFTITRVTDGTTTVSVSNSLGLINT